MARFKKNNYRRDRYKNNRRERNMYKFVVIIFIFAIIGVILWDAQLYNYNEYIIGGQVYDRFKFDNKSETTDHIKTVFNYIDEQQIQERFQRSSKKVPLDLKYQFKIPRGTIIPPYIPEGYPKKYESSEDVIHAYYSILNEASNMIGYSGGCGTIGDSRIPYPYAYQLLTDKTKEEMSIEEFKDSFSGIGHINLLNLYPAYHPKKSSFSEKYYMIEIETIVGLPVAINNNKNLASTYFAYYYGIISTKYEKGEGWKIKSVNYISEDFLCAPYHHWYWDSRALVDIIYNSWYNIVDKIDKVEQKDSLISIYASGKGKKYKFDFIRLTNGEDVLLHEYVYESGKWKEVNMLKPEHKGYKLTIQSIK